MIACEYRIIVYDTPVIDNDSIVLVSDFLNGIIGENEHGYR